jgi:hypothetical protein
MSITITHVRYAGLAKTHEAISHVAYDGGESRPKQVIVEWLDAGNQAFVGTGAARVEVGTVHESGKQPYLRTFADGFYSNNLLSLPVF